MEKVISYIDGYNLYHGLKSQGWKWAYWLNIHLMISNLLSQNQKLITTKYFTTRVSEPEDKRLRQQKFLEALGTIPEIKFFYGKYVPDDITCRQCGHTYTTYHEKMTDVNIAVEMLTDAMKDKYDVAVLLSGDRCSSAQRLSSLAWRRESNKIVNPIACESSGQSVAA